jgi:NADH-quinone oxidoreductase subunit N
MPALWALTVLTIVGGNILAVAQKNVKRMLAYSSIAHAGYLLIGIVAGSDGNALGLSAILFYLLSYTFLNIGAFGVISVLENQDGTGFDASDLRGLWRRQPLLAGLLAFFLLSLAGFPPMAGFAAKFYIFYAALASGHPELLIIGVVASILGMYYYLRPIATMFMEHDEPAPASEAHVSGPLPGTGRQISGKLVAHAGSSSATAVAVKTAPARRKTAVIIEEAVAEPRVPTAWPTKVALTLAVLGTLAMGTVLPFWLIQLAQQAAHLL